MLYQLEFPTAKLLNRFLQTLGSVYTEVNLRTLSIVCECTEAHISAAINDYQAKVTVIKK